MLVTRLFLGREVFSTSTSIRVGNPNFLPDLGEKLVCTLSFYSAEATHGRR